MHFAIFLVHLSKLLRLPGKSDARSYEVLHLSRKIISANLKIWYSKMQPLSGNHRPDLLTALMKMSLVLRLPRKMHLCRFSLNVPRLPSFWEMLQNPHVLLTPQSLAPATRKHIWTSKSGADMLCFVHFDFEMCFAPQRRALFRHLNFQKRSGHGVFCTFWLRNVLRATTACTFSTSQLPKVIRSWCVLNILTWKCASRHNGVHFFDIAASKSGPRPWCALYILTSKSSSCNNGVQFFISAALARLLFDPLEPQIIGKTQCFATFLPFRAPASSFFWLFLFSDFFLSSILLSSTVLFSLTLPISAFHLSILSEVWLRNVLRLSSITLISGPKNTIDPIRTPAFPGFIVRASGLESRRNFTSVFSSIKVPPTM